MQGINPWRGCEKNLEKNVLHSVSLPLGTVVDEAVVNFVAQCCRVLVCGDALLGDVHPLPPHLIMEQEHSQAWAPTSPVLANILYPEVSQFSLPFLSSGGSLI